MDIPLAPDIFTLGSDLIKKVQILSRTKVLGWLPEMLCCVDRPVQMEYIVRMPESWISIFCLHILLSISKKKPILKY